MPGAGSRAWLIALVALGMACSRARAPAEQFTSGRSAAVASRPKRPASPKKAGPEQLETSRSQPRLDEGCTAGVEPSASLVGSLRELERQCISSMRPLLEEPAIIEVTALAGAEVAFSLADPTGCVRVAAALDPGLAEIELGILDPDGSPHVAHVQGGPFALLGPQGPVCFDRAGRYRVELRVRRGSGRVAVNVWTAR